MKSRPAQAVVTRQLVSKALTTSLTAGNGANAMPSSQSAEVAASTNSQPERAAAVPEASSRSPPVETMDAVSSALQGVHEGDLPNARLYVMSLSPVISDEDRVHDKL